MLLIISFYTSPKQKSRFLADPDEVLLALYREKGEMEIIAEIHRRYSHLIAGVCVKYLRDDEKARDATMQVFEKLIVDLRVHTVDNFKSWLYSVAKNQCLMEIRKNASQSNHLESIYENSSERFVEIWDELHLNTEFELEQKIKALHDALNELNSEQRTCIDLFYLKDKSYNEISDMEGIDVKLVKSHIQNGKRNLRIHLEKMYDVE
jgi:RNA polymerase sigma-70 factor (ECF subfamily)